MMTAAATPIKVERATDELISHASHFLGRAKKDIVDAAVREYIDGHRDQINDGIREALRQLDGSAASSLSLLTGVSVDEINNEFGGLPPE